VELRVQGANVIESITGCDAPRSAMACPSGHPGWVMPVAPPAATVRATTGPDGPLPEERPMPQPTETPVLDLLATMTASSLEASELDPKTLMQVRIAALVAVDAPPASYLMNLGAASELGVDADAVRSVLAAIAPIVGTARTVAALGNIARALGLALELAEDDAS
jgi:alkylhydroperoxidase/carboxymuconolactone decarboxylase family protein YurZ